MSAAAYVNHESHSRAAREGRLMLWIGFHRHRAEKHQSDYALVIWIDWVKGGRYATQMEAGFVFLIFSLWNAVCTYVLRYVLPRLG